MHETGEPWSACRVFSEADRGQVSTFSSGSSSQGTPMLQRRRFALSKALNRIRLPQKRRRCPSGTSRACAVVVLKVSRSANDSQFVRGCARCDGRWQRLAPGTGTSATSGSETGSAADASSAAGDVSYLAGQRSAVTAAGADGLRQCRSQSAAEWARDLQRRAAHPESAAPHRQVVERPRTSPAQDAGRGASAP